LSKNLNLHVIAEGVETESEYQICKKIGCDLIQGYYISYPTKNTNEIKTTYIVDDYSNFDLKQKEYITEDRKLIEEHLVPMQGLYVENPIDRALKMLKDNNKTEIIPILDIQNRPVGIIKESKIKDYLLSPYGKDILKRKSIKDIIEKVFINDVNISVDKLIELL
jgi:hypothetical protein